MTFRRKPVSAEEMIKLINSWDGGGFNIWRLVPQQNYRSKFTYGERRDAPQLKRRAQRLLLHWWRRGIEREEVERYEEWRQDAEAHLANELRGPR